MDERDAWREQVEKVRASGFLGRTRLLRLFDHLAEATAQGLSPKEATIAIDVFGRGGQVDVAQDATVRVYVHNLRRKLDAYYAGPGLGEPRRLTVPRGEYRLVLAPAAPASVAPSDASTPVVASPPHRTGWLLAGGFAIACLAALATAWWLRSDGTGSGLQALRARAPWATLLRDDRPTVVVVGDYYIFGDTEKSLGVRRLVREFDINSRDDLQQYLIAHPELAERYMDVELGYLPTSTAAALASVLPVLAGGDGRHVRVMLMSALDPATIKSANLVYIGLLSGLGALQNAAFAGSRFALGESFNEIIDRPTQRHYYSEASRYEGFPRHSGGDPAYRDYGFFASFAGLGGNRIVVIAGTQDEGVRQTAEMVADPVRLDEIARASGRVPDVAALYEVSGMDRVNLSGRLLAAAKVDIAETWRAR